MAIVVLLLVLGLLVVGLLVVRVMVMVTRGMHMTLRAHVIQLRSAPLRLWTGGTIFARCPIEPLLSVVNAPFTFLTSPLGVHRNSSAEQPTTQHKCHHCGLENLKHRGFLPSIKLGDT